MSIDLLSLISQFRPADDRENANACFMTRVPWVALEAYLNIVYKPAPAGLLSEVAEKWAFPSVVVDFLSRQNGAMLFSGALNLYGVVEPGRLSTGRIDFLCHRSILSGKTNPGRSIQIACSWSEVTSSTDRAHASTVRMGRFTSFRRGRIPRISWASFDSWLLGETRRLLFLFDEDGKRIGPDSDTGPPQSAVVSER